MERTKHSMDVAFRNSAEAAMTGASSMKAVDSRSPWKKAKAEIEPPRIIAVRRPVHMVLTARSFCPAPEF